MKKKSGNLLQFSGYPLRLVANPTETRHPKASVVKIPKQEKEDPANNPRNWDAGWFSNYE
jgi:hypothetical protein